MKSTARTLLLPLAHLLALWAFAVAQPLYDILQRHGDFFVAHRAGPAELVSFAALVSIGLPLLLAAPYVVTALAAPRAGRVVLIALVALLSAALASQIMAHRLESGAVVHFLLAASAGVAVAAAYARLQPVRWFLSILAAGVLIFPALFLASPQISAFMRGDAAARSAAAEIAGPVPPIVFVVFDQLPLTSLLDSRGAIDRARYPGFARLADRATWYRNASTMADFTGWVMPTVLAGVTPRRGGAPTSKSYPANLFTWLSGRYRLEVKESITQFCPESLCDDERVPLAVRVGGMATDSSVVYARAALPAGLREHLPPLTENWRDFIADQRWQRRWVAERDSDRRRLPQEFIESIGRDDEQPTLYFLHALLPHEPYVFLRSGQRFASDRRMPGLREREVWTSDPWPVTLAYRRHLLQLEYVDALVGRLLDRLEEEGLYDEALLIVTSDHGVSFRPGQPFKGLRGETLADNLPVPLFIKAPGQRDGAVDDRNIQSFDIVPTIARLIGVPLSWQAEGSPGGEANGSTKRVFYNQAVQVLDIETRELARLRDEGLARKIALFGEGAEWPPMRPPDASAGLIGRDVAAIGVTEGPWQAELDGADELAWIQEDGAELPAFVSGVIRDRVGRAVDARLAVAVNGRIAALTRTFSPRDAGRAGRWDALLDPSALRPGRNVVQVFVIPPDEERRLHLAYTPRVRPPYLNLITESASEHWDVRQSGLYPPEGDPVRFRWTDGTAVFDVPVDPDSRPRSVRVVLAGARPGGSPLTLTVNGCSLYSGPIDAQWHRTFSLRECPAGSLDGRRWRLTLSTPSWSAEGDARQLGVAIETLNVLQEDWPLSETASRALRGELSVIGNDARRQAGTPVRVVISNVGEAIWMPAGETGGGPPIHLALRWRAAGGGAEHEQQLRLPRPIFPSDRVLVDTPLMPPQELNGSGPWTVTIVPVARDGTPVPVDGRLVLDVDAAGR